MRAEPEAIGTLTAEIRRTLEEIAIPEDLAAAIEHSVERLGSLTACAVRSSANAEDLPTASFAGLEDYGSRFRCKPAKPGGSG